MGRGLFVCRYVYDVHVRVPLCVCEAATFRNPFLSIMGLQESNRSAGFYRKHFYPLNGFPGSKLIHP